jgi:histidine triad (HIT) family protein
MFQHAPEGYVCPFCRVAQGTYDALTTQQDVVFQDSLVTVFIAPFWWPNNEGHVLIIPNSHFENLYELPARYAYRIQDLTQAIALAFKQVYRCHGVSIRQHNEPASGQDVWHFTYMSSQDTPMIICITAFDLVKSRLLTSAGRMQHNYAPFWQADQSDTASPMGSFSPQRGQLTFFSLVNSKQLLPAPYLENS